MILSLTSKVWISGQKNKVFVSDYISRKNIFFCIFFYFKKFVSDKLHANLESVGVSVIFFLDTNMSQATICNNDYDIETQQRVSLSDCFEQVASVKTLVMYKGLLENAMQIK